MRLDDCAQFEHGPTEFSEACARAANEHCSGLARHTRTATHFVYERLELCALVVPDDDSTRLQFVSELLRHVVVKRVHQASPPSAAAAALRRPPLLRPALLPLATGTSRRLFSADFTAGD